MEKKNQNPLPPHYPEQDAFEEYTNPDPNEITPQQYETPDDYRRRRERSDDKVILDDGEGENRNSIDEDGYDEVIDVEEDDDEISGYSSQSGDDEEEENSGYSNQLDHEDEYMPDEEDGDYDENKSPLRPIDANKSPEEWRGL